jgi:hypothetical protein
MGAGSANTIAGASAIVRTRAAGNYVPRPAGSRLVDHRPRVLERRSGPENHGVDHEQRERRES